MAPCIPLVPSPTTTPEELYEQGALLGQAEVQCLLVVLRQHHRDLTQDELLLELCAYVEARLRTWGSSRIASAWLDGWRQSFASAYTQFPLSCCPPSDQPPSSLLRGVSVIRGIGQVNPQAARQHFETLFINSGQPAGQEKGASHAEHV